MIDATGIGRASGRDILIRGTAVHGTNGAGSMGRDRETSGRGGGTREGPEVRVDPISDYTFDQLYGIAKSQKHFAVLLIQNLFTREQLNGCSVYGGRNGKFGLGKILLEMVKGFYLDFIQWTWRTGNRSGRIV